MQAVVRSSPHWCRAATTGEGAYLDVAVADGVLALMSLQIDDVLATGAEQPPRRRPSSGRYACYDTYRTADDRWVAVARDRGQVLGEPVPPALGLDDWVDRQFDDAAQDEAQRRSRRGLQHAHAATSGSRRSPRPTPACHLSLPRPRRRRPGLRRPRCPRDGTRRHRRHLVPAARRCLPAPNARRTTTFPIARSPTPRRCSLSAVSPRTRSPSCGTKERLRE